MSLVAARRWVRGGVPHIYAKAAPGGFQHNIALISSPFWDDKALKSVPSGSTGGSPNIVRPPSSRQVWARLPPPTEVTTEGEATRRQERPPPDTFLSSSSEDVLKITSYVAPWRQTVSGSQDGHPTSEGGADKPPDPTEKDMRRISEGGEELRIGICGGE